MIVSKNKQSNTGTETVITELVAEPVNPLTAAYNAVKEILMTIKEDWTIKEDEPDIPPFFKTIKFDNGQLARVKGRRQNTEYPIVFPAVFIHFIDVNYRVGQSNISEGKGSMRIHYVLNRLNNSDDVVETEVLEMFSLINSAIQDQKGKYPALAKKFQLAYWDQPLSFDDGLQPCWIEYDIEFNDYTAYTQRNYVERYIVIPPFTDHSDQDEDKRNGHEDHNEPLYEDLPSFVYPKADVNANVQTGEEGPENGGNSPENG